jgi:hypothetical protein
MVRKIRKNIQSMEFLKTHQSRVDEHTKIDQVVDVLKSKSYFIFLRP